MLEAAICSKERVSVFPCIEEPNIIEIRSSRNTRVSHRNGEFASISLGDDAPHGLMPMKAQGWLFKMRVARSIAAYEAKYLKQERHAEFRRAHLITALPQHYIGASVCSK